MAIATTNPATGEVVKTFEPLTGAQIEQKLQLAASAFRNHRKTSFAERAKKMMRARDFGKWFPIRACLSVASSTQATGANSPCMGFANL